MEQNNNPIKDDTQNIKINKAQHEEFLEICRRVGIRESRAIVKFIKNSIENDGFDLDLSNYVRISKDKTDTRMSYRIDKESKVKFKKLCQDNGISVSGAIKIFMDDVIQSKSMDKYF